MKLTQVLDHISALKTLDSFNNPNIAAWIEPLTLNENIIVTNNGYDVNVNDDEDNDNHREKLEDYIIVNEVKDTALNQQVIYKKKSLSKFFQSDMETTSNNSYIQFI